MACSRCNQNRNRAVSDFLYVPVQTTKRGYLSAPVLLAQGWVRTCTKCGTRTKPSPILEQIIPACNCE